MRNWLVYIVVGVLSLYVDRRLDENGQEPILFGLFLVWILLLTFWDRYESDRGHGGGCQ